MAVSIYVEERIGDIAVGWRYYIDTSEWEKIEQVGLNREVTYTCEEGVPDSVKKAVSILIEEGVDNE